MGQRETEGERVAEGDGEREGAKKRAALSVAFGRSCALANSDLRKVTVSPQLSSSLSPLALSRSPSPSIFQPFPNGCSIQSSSYAISLSSPIAAARVVRTHIIRTLDYSHVVRLYFVHAKDTRIRMYGPASLRRSYSTFWILLR